MRRRKGGHATGGGGGHGGGEERWMASYMDMVTVLMCLFIVLYAMSTVDAQKWDNLKFALATGFGHDASNSVDTATGIVVPQDQVGDAGPSQGYAGYNQQPTELQQLMDLQQQLSDQLGSSGIGANVDFEVTDRGLVIKLTGAATFFDGNSARLRADAIQVLDTLAPALTATGRELSIEGHADPRYNPAPFATTWELAAARATGVLRHLVEANGFPGDKISGTTYGSARPASDEVTQNRRVDIVVLSSDPEALAQQLAAGSNGSSPAGAGTTTGSSSSGTVGSGGSGSGEPITTTGGPASH